MNRLAELRRALGLTQMELKELAGVSQGTISKAESDSEQIIMNRESLISVCKAMNVSADYLLGLTDDPRPARTDVEITLEEWAILRALRDGDIERAAALVRGEVPDVD